MSIIEVTTTSRGKCLSCRFYFYDNDWTFGECENREAKVKRRQRNWNDRACSAWRMDQGGKNGRKG